MCTLYRTGATASALAGWWPVCWHHVPHQPPRLILAWESLPTPWQVGIAYIITSTLLFALNDGPLHQPLVRSIGYGLFEGLIPTWVIITATQHEKRKRRGGD
jgi:hypothetical protein